MATLKDLRGQRFITQAELAKKAGIGRDTVNQVERGRQKPSFLTIRKLAAALGVAPGQIEFPGSAESPPETKKPSSKKLWNQPAPFASLPHEVKAPKS